MKEKITKELARWEKQHRDTIETVPIGLRCGCNITNYAVNLEAEKIVIDALRALLREEGENEQA